VIEWTVEDVGSRYIRSKFSHLYMSNADSVPTWYATSHFVLSPSAILCQGSISSISGLATLFHDFTLLLATTMLSDFASMPPFRKRAAKNTSSDDELEDLREKVRHIGKKRRRSRKVAFRECILCDETRSSLNFHVLDGCDHELDICGTCYAASLTSQINNTAWDLIACPSDGCTVCVTDQDINLYAS
jgi:hypothetical protein